MCIARGLVPEGVAVDAVMLGDFLRRDSGGRDHGIEAVNVLPSGHVLKHQIADKSNVKNVNIISLVLSL